MERAVTILGVLLLLATSPCPLASSAGTISAPDLARGRWALGFVVIPGCPACERVIAWFGRVAQGFPEVRFLVVTPKLSAELEVLAGGFPIYVDLGGAVGAALGVRRAPTVLLFAAGAVAARLDWPFTEERLREELTALLRMEIPDPLELLGHRAPDFSAADLAGKAVSLGDLPRPLLLVFFNPGCPPCWEALGGVAEISRDVAVAVLAVVGEGELTPADQGRLEGFLRSVQQKPVTVLLVRDPEILRAYGVTRSPSLILLDGKGVVIWVADGVLSRGELLLSVRAALTRAD